MLWILKGYLRKGESWTKVQNEAKNGFLLWTKNGKMPKNCGRIFWPWGYWNTGTKCRKIWIYKIALLPLSRRIWQCHCIYWQQDTVQWFMGRLDLFKTSWNRCAHICDSAWLRGNISLSVKRRAKRVNGQTVLFCRKSRHYGTVWYFLHRAKRYNYTVKMRICDTSFLFVFQWIDLGRGKQSLCIIPTNDSKTANHPLYICNNL